jgi:hypothetical protein
MRAGIDGRYWHQRHDLVKTTYIPVGSSATNIMSLPDAPTPIFLRQTARAVGGKNDRHKGLSLLT